MKVDGTLLGTELADIPRKVREFEAAGFDGVFTSETNHDPFLPLALAAEHSTTLEIGTAIAVAFPRSPMHLANLGWDLQAYSGGRMHLGLGSQIKVHIEKRFSAPWTSPVARMREMVQAIREIWRSWETGERLNFRGELYSHTLMTPFFTPPPHGHGQPRIQLAAVGEHMTELAGEVADGLLVHGFNTATYFRDTMLPSLEAGLRTAGRSRADVEIASLVFVVTGTTEEQYETRKAQAKQQLSFYGSTPGYRGVLEAHGWGDLQTELNALTKAGRWDDMPGLISDEILEAFAVIAEPKHVAAKVQERFGGLYDRISIYDAFGQEPADWADVVAGFTR